MASPAKPILIKKYGNRRLYDTSQSKYITLEDLAEIIREGTEVKVVEASSGRDLTRGVLTQVILEHQDAMDMIPVELLHAIIRVRGTLEQAPFAAFLAAVTRQFVEAGNLWSRQWAGFFGGAEGDAPAEPEPPEPEATGPEPAGPAAEPERPAGPSKGPVANDIDALRRRMDALLNKLGKA